MKNLFFSAVASALLLVLGSCASPTTSGSTASTTASAAVSGFAKGLITAKGSIWVNGVEYSTTSATATEDGTTAAAGDDSGLKVGMTVSLKGTVNPSTGKGTAQTINYESSLKGTATSIAVTAPTTDAFTGTFLVFGQTVKTTASTIFEGTGSLTTLGQLTSPFVEVSGQLDSSSILVANRVEYKTTPDPFKLRGTVSALAPSSSGGGTFTLTTEEAKTFSVTYTGTLDAAVVNTSEVRVLFTSAPTNSTVTTTAANIKVRPAELQGAEGDRIEVDGIISNYVSSPVTFTLDGRNISATAAVAKAAGTIGNGTKVEVKGTLTSGVVVASSISTKNEPNLEVKGLVTAVSLTASTFTVGTTVLHVNSLTMFHDANWKGTNPLSTLVSTGTTPDNVSVKYYTDATGVNQAVRVERQ